MKSKDELRQDAQGVARYYYLPSEIQQYNLNTEAWVRVAGLFPITKEEDHDDMNPYNQYLEMMAVKRLSWVQGYNSAKNKYTKGLPTTDELERLQRSIVAADPLFTDILIADLKKQIDNICNRTINFIKRLNK